VNFSRFLIVTAAFAATVSVSDDIAAQSLTNDEPVVAQSTWTSGYMGLGGGLLTAIPAEPAKTKPIVKTAAEPVASTPVKRASVVRRSAPRVVRPSYDPNTPAALIAGTLDHTGENIATLGSPTQ